MKYKIHLFEQPSKTSEYDRRNEDTSEHQRRYQSVTAIEGECQ